MNETNGVRQEYWKDEGRDVLLMRCECWRSLKMGGVADNNGWFPPERYPHSPYCKERRL